MRGIKFTKPHVKKLKKGNKITTLRTIKSSNLYAEGSKVKVKGSDLFITIRKRDIVLFKREMIELFGAYGTLDKEEVSYKEGFNSWGDLINWFEERNYNIPQPMFYYHFRISNQSSLNMYKED